jgi:hypothetical protein
MSPKNSEDIPAEFPLRPGGGVRGKYYESYTQGATIKIVFAEGTPFLVRLTSSGLRTAGITRTDLSPITARIQFGDGSVLPPAHAR